jgi:hypothetical protein
MNNLDFISFVGADLRVCPNYLTGVRIRITNLIRLWRTNHACPRKFQSGGLSLHLYQASLDIFTIFLIRPECLSFTPKVIVQDV